MVPMDRSYWGPHGKIMVRIKMHKFYPQSMVIIIFYCFLCSKHGYCTNYISNQIYLKDNFNTKKALDQLVSAILFAERQICYRLYHRASIFYYELTNIALIDLTIQPDVNHHRAHLSPRGQHLTRPWGNANFFDWLLQNRCRSMQIQLIRL